MTRKSSCLNARGIPTAAYQVLHLLPKVGYPPRQWGPPQPDPMGDTQGGIPPDRGRPPPWPDLIGVPEVRYPLAGVPPSQVWQGVPKWGTRGGVPPACTWLGYPPSCGQTDRWTDTCQNITFPRTTYVVGNNNCLFISTVRVPPRTYNTWTSTPTTPSITSLTVLITFRWAGQPSLIEFYSIDNGASFLLQNIKYLSKNKEIQV